MTDINSLTAKTKEYIEKCNKRVIYHDRQAKNSKLWDSCLNVGNIIMTAGLAFSMTLMSVLSVPDQLIAITGAIFSFAILVGNRLRDEFDFKVLAFQHDSSADDYSELRQAFDLIVNDIENHRSPYSDLHTLMIKYEATIQKSHHRQVCDCNILCCCIKIDEL